MGVVVRRYIDFLIILLIPTPLVSVLFYSSIPTFCSFKKCFSFFSIIVRTCMLCSFFNCIIELVVSISWDDIGTPLMQYI